MGKASRWLRTLFGANKKSPSNSKDKRRWGFVHSFREKPTPSSLSDHLKGTSYRDLAPLSLSLSLEDDQDDQNKRAIAVAAATAAVAEAAVAAAQAAAAVVRLTSSGRSPVNFGRLARREWAAVKIQSSFRGYLARRALRALRGLVKLQALVRGNIVRKQAAETIRCMQSLVRVQARARAGRSLQSDRGPHLQAGPATPEKHEHTIKGTVRDPDTPVSLKRNSSKSSGIHAAAGWNWLDKWMENRYWDSREATRRAASAEDDKNDKILEVDTGKPRFSHKNRGNHPNFSPRATVNSEQNSNSLTTMPESPSKQSVPNLSSAETNRPLRSALEAGDYYVESPQFYSASSRQGSSRRGPFTPLKSECSRSLFNGYSDYPNYMSNTEASRAKVRSQSAPKQRQEFDKSSLVKRNSSSHGVMQNHSVATSHRSSSSLHAKFANKAYPGSGRLDRLGMPFRV